MLKIQIKVSGSQALEHVDTVLKGFPRYFSEYAFSKINTVLKKYENDAIKNVIYGSGGVRRRTGSLGKALRSYAVRINQYAFSIVSDFSDRVSYVNTHVGTGTTHITAKNSKYLWVPKPGGAADVYPRKPVRSFYYKGHKMKDIYCFVTNVTVKNRINPEDLRMTLNAHVSSSIPSLAARALKNWKQLNGL